MKQKLINQVERYNSPFLDGYFFYSFTVTKNTQKKISHTVFSQDLALEITESEAKEDVISKTTSTTERNPLESAMLIMDMRRITNGIPTSGNIRTFSGKILLDWVMKNRSLERDESFRICEDIQKNFQVFQRVENSNENSTIVDSETIIYKFSEKVENFQEMKNPEDVMKESSPNVRFTRDKLSELCNRLHNNDFTLREIILSKSNLDFEDCYKILEALKENVFLQKLDLSYNNIR